MIRYNPPCNSMAQVGKPTKDWKNDPEGKPESAVSKALRSTAKQAAKTAKNNIPSTGNKYADGAISTGLSVAESQADADPNTSMKDRLKMAGGDVVTGVADTVDNPVVSVAANIAKVKGYIRMLYTDIKHRKMWGISLTIVLVLLTSSQHV